MPQIEFISGPLHPDLFDGATPIMIPCSLPRDRPARFIVEVCWPKDGDIECSKLTVVARDQDEAVERALRVARPRHSKAEVVEVHRGRRRPTLLEIEAWEVRS